jgi:hypothetical protein
MLAYASVADPDWIGAPVDPDLDRRACGSGFVSARLWICVGLARQRIRIGSSRLSIRIWIGAPVDPDLDRRAYISGFGSARL